MSRTVDKRDYKIDVSVIKTACREKAGSARGYLSKCEMGHRCCRLKVGAGHGSMAQVAGSRAWLVNE